MSYHSGRISPIASETPSQEESKISEHPAPSQSSSSATKDTTKDQKLSGLGRAVQNLLLTPQSARSAGTGIKRRISSRRRRRRGGGGARSPVEPLVSSPLRHSSSVSTMASAPSSPERPKAGNEGLQRRSSDQFAQEVSRRASATQGLGNDEDSKSEVGSNISEPMGPKKNKTQGRSAVAAMMSGLESRFFPKSLSRGRDSSRAPGRRGSSLDSRSPSSTSRFSRSISPNTRLQSGSRSTTASTEKVNELKMENTKGQSSEALSKRSSGLPDYVKPAEQEESGERLAKDVFDRDQNMIESSDDDGDESSSEDENIPGVTVVHARGRKKKNLDISTITLNDFSKPQGSSTPEEKKPSDKPSNPTAGKKPRKSALKAVVHPQTSFDIPTPHTQSAAGTPYGSEDEAELDDVHRAQGLGITISTIDNRVPNRSIRTIIRGDFASLQEEADQGRRRQRKYLVALDLSEESVYALEWTIGAVLRDGDTMFAIYAMHEDTNTASVQVGEGAKAMQDATAVVGSQTKEAVQNHSRTILGRLGPGSSSKSSSVDARVSSAAEAERVKAVETVSDTCVKLLRKTLLQVRIAVEVIHCKSPKLLVTEAIDELEPTLVIVGARGQSALKGVLLGSFSNYLLSNSSVPVMVARRKLKRHPSKGRLNNMRLANNLKAPKSLTQAKVD